MSLWTTFLYQPLINLLMFVYQSVGGGLGVAIITMTILIRAALLPLTMPSLKSSQKMQELKPELDKLKEKHGKDKQALAQAQMDLYKQHGVNPLGGFLPMIVQLVVLIALFQAFNNVLRANGNTIAQLNQILYPFNQLAKNTVLQTKFLYLDVTKPDVISLGDALKLGFITIGKLPGPLLLLAAVSQYFSSKITMPKAVKQQTDKSSDSPEDMAMSMQKQMLIFMPVMTILIGLNFPSGLVLYWLTFSVVMVVQQVLLKKIKKTKE